MKRWDWDKDPDPKALMTTTGRFRKYYLVEAVIDMDNRKMTSREYEAYNPDLERMMDIYYPKAKGDARARNRVYAPLRMTEAYLVARGKLVKKAKVVKEVTPLKNIEKEIKRGERMMVKRVESIEKQREEVRAPINYEIRGSITQKVAEQMNQILDQSGELLKNRPENPFENRLCDFYENQWSVLSDKMANGEEIKGEEWKDISKMEKFLLSAYKNTKSVNNARMYELTTIAELTVNGQKALHGAFLVESMAEERNMLPILEKSVKDENEHRDAIRYMDHMFGSKGFNKYAGEKFALAKDDDSKGE